jgi:fatty-acyl-CoA synthase
MMGTKLSYVHGACDVPLIGETIGSFFDGIAERFPDREALIVRHQNVSCAYGELQRLADGLAARARARRSHRHLVAK